MNGVVATWSAVSRAHRARGHRWVVPSAVGCAIVLADQITKALVVRAWGPSRADHRWNLLDPLVAIQYVENTGGAFGTLRGQGAVLSGLALLVIGALVLYYRALRAPALGVTISLGLLLGGAVGNLIDRARWGYVVDFVAIGVWPKFNVADSAISIGVILLAWHMVMGRDDVAVTTAAASATITERPAGPTED